MRKNRLAILLAAMAVSTCHAQSQQPAAGIAGAWRSDARLTSTLPNRPQDATFWVGLTWGRIEPSGRVLVYTDMGCQFTGLLTSGYQRFEGLVNMTKCPQQEMNRRYEIRVTGGQPNLLVKLKAQGVESGILNSYELEGTFVRYQPSP